MMDIKELINRPLCDIFQVDELCFVVEHYILRRKNVQVKINIYKTNHPMFVNLQVRMLEKAFDISSKWLRSNEKDS